MSAGQYQNSIFPYFFQDYGYSPESWLTDIKREYNITDLEVGEYVEVERHFGGESVFDYIHLLR